MTGYFSLVYIYITDCVFNREPPFSTASGPLALARKCIFPLRLSFIAFPKRPKHEGKWVSTAVLDSKIWAACNFYDRSTIMLAVNGYRSFEVFIATPMTPMHLNCITSENTPTCISQCNHIVLQYIKVFTFTQSLIYDSKTEIYLFFFCWSWKTEWKYFFSTIQSYRKIES